MRKTWIFSCFIVLSVLWCLPMYGQQLSSYAKNGVIRVKLDPAVAEQLGNTPKTRGGVVSTGIKPFDAVNKQLKAINMKRVFPYAPKFEEQMRRHGLHLWYEISYDKPVTPEQAVNQYKGIEGVKIAEIVRVRNLSPYKIEPANLPQRPQSRAGVPFNDPGLSQQWHYHNDGSVQNSVAGCDINLYKAWEVTTGKREIVVAIIDGGIDINHEDLKGRIWVNEAELNGEEGVDDDGDGHVDDIYGYNFAAKSGAITPHDHGTHVAGTVGAINNNGIGVCGVAGGSGNDDGVRLMSCQVFDNYAGQGDFALPFVYAAHHGAVITQCSWGWPSPDYFEQAVLDAIDYFTKEAGNYEGSPMKGGVCIFSAGNTGKDERIYPGAHPTVVSVTSLAPDFKMSNFSTHGDWAHVAAPGGDMDLGGEYWGVLSTTPNNTYSYMQGTSMACPHVSGIAALILSKFGGPEFTNTELRNRLIESVHDIYPYNQQYIGKLGSGYIDAFMALEQKNTTGPEAVTDIELVASQEDIHVEWNIPADPDGDNIAYCQVYYSEQAFTTSSDLSAIKSVKAATRYLKTGDKASADIPELKAETNYWVAVKAFDRWENASALSEVKQIKTNEGPVLEIQKTALTLNMDVTKSYKASDSLIISNTGEGMLKWSISMNGSKNSVSPQSINPIGKKEINLKTSAYRGSPHITAVTPLEVIESGVEMDEYPRLITYNQGIHFHIGESDTAQWNSLAQYFYIDQNFFPDGYNLTAVQLQGNYTQGKAILQIYKGVNNFTEKDLISSDTIEYNPFNQYLTLNQESLFQPGEGFWIVFHMPNGNKNPLGCGDEIEESNAASYSYYSSNKGKNWHLLKDVLSEGNLKDYAKTQTWVVTAVSQNPGWIQYLTTTPASGTVKPHENQKVCIAPKEMKFINGIYNFNLYVNSNYTHEPEILIPGTMTISGHEPELKSAKVIDFGKIFTGEEKKVEVEIYNAGYGRFCGVTGSYLYKNSSYSFSAPEFDVSEGYISPFSARATKRVVLSFKPTREAVFQSTFTLKNDKGATHTITLTGTAIEPARIAVNPTAVDAGDLVLGDAPKTETFTITNNGSYPLEFVFPKFTEDTVAGLGKTSHKYGYQYISNIPGYNESANCEYRWDDLLNATDVQNQLQGSRDFWTEGVDIGFKFPFYGKEFEKVYIGQYGCLSFSGEEGTMHSCGVPESSSTCSSGLDLITALGKACSYSPQSKVVYSRQGGKFIVSYENVIPVASTPVSFRIALSPNGDIEVWYKEYDPYSVLNPDGIFLACVDYDVEDPFTITDSDVTRHEGLDLWMNIGPGTAFKILAPGKNMIRNVTPNSGVVAINSTQTIEVELSADSSMNSGPLNNLLALLSNDPDQGASIIRFDANITGSYYKPELSLDQDTLRFGEIMQTAEEVRAITLKNSGKDGIDITAISVSDPSFSLKNKALPFTLAAGTSEDIYITAPSSQKGSFETGLTVTPAEGSPLKAHILVTVVEAPDIQLTPASFTETVEGDSMAQVNLAIKNTGESTLKYSIVPTTLFYPLNDSIKAGESIDYIFASSFDNQAINYQWEDISATYDVYKNADFLLENMSFEQELPFPFTFYGKTYDKIYIYGPGFITFKKFPKLEMWPEEFSADFTPYIAPYWGHHTPSPREYALDPTMPPGVYYKEEAERVIISYIDYSNAMSLGLCYQAILYKNGNIKFQYKVLEGGIQWANFGINGLAYEGSEYEKTRMTLTDRYLDMTSEPNAIEFYPVKTSELAVGETAEMTMEINTTGLMAGDYYSADVIRTNVPTKPEVELPLYLTITGTAAGSWPEKLDMPDIPIGSWSMPYEFTFRNTGTAAYHITGVTCKTIENVDPFDPWATPDFDVQYWMTGGGGIDPGPLAANVQPRNGGFVSILQLPVSELNPLTVGKEPQKFAIQVFNANEFMEKIDTLIVNTDLPGYETIRIPLRYAIVDIPVATVNPEKIDLYASSKSFTCDTTIEISNTGNYKLSYTVDLSFNEASSQAASAGMPVMTKQQILSNGVGKGTLEVLPVTRAEGYTDSLTYAFDMKTLLVIGPKETDLQNYIACTEYIAPEKGFNISTIKFYGSLGNLESEEFMAEVRIGSSFSNNSVLTTGKVVATGGPEITQGQAMITLKTIELDRPAYINPGEKFWVYVYLKPGTMAAMSSLDDDPVTGRFVLGTNTGWEDLTGLIESYGILGWLQKIYEKETSSSWLTMEAQDSTLQPQESATITLHVNAGLTRYEAGNTANVIIKSTDPQNPTITVPVRLTKNTAPVITQTDKNISVKEEQEATVKFTVVDNEKDHFDLTLEDETGIATLERDSNNVTVTLAPKYGDHGDHNFTLKAKDQYENESSLLVNYYVEKVNRAPIVVQQPADKMQKVGDAVESLILSTVFSDPDGDELTYTALSSNPEAVQAFVSEDNAIEFVIKAQGEANITLTAKDPALLAATTTFKVTVEGGSSGSGIFEAQVKAYPNPTSNILKVQCSDDVEGEVIIRLYGMSGNIVYTEKTAMTAGSIKELDVKALPAGMYVLEIEHKGAKITSKVVKQ